MREKGREEELKGKNAWERKMERLLRSKIDSHTIPGVREHHWKIFGAATWFQEWDSTIGKFLKQPHDYESERAPLENFRSSHTIPGMREHHWGTYRWEKQSHHRKKENNRTIEALPAEKHSPLRLLRQKNTHRQVRPDFLRPLSHFEERSLRTRILGERLPPPWESSRSYLQEHKCARCQRKFLSINM